MCSSCGGPVDEAELDELAELDGAVEDVALTIADGAKSTDIADSDALRTRRGSSVSTGRALGCFSHTSHLEPQSWPTVLSC